MLITKFKLLISMCIYFACMPSVVDAETYYPGAGGRMGIIDYYTCLLYTSDAADE